MLLVKVLSVLCQNACEFLNLDYILSILQNKVSNHDIDLSLTGYLLWSTVRLESYSLVISVKMGQICTDCTEIRFVVLHLGIFICLWLLLIAVNIQNSGITSAGLSFSLEIKSSPHSCTRTLEDAELPPCEGGSTTQF